MNKIKVTIIVPIYKVPVSYLRKCLESLHAQKDRDMLQVIIVDDGSPDKEALAVCDRYANEFEILHKPNGGVSTARNLGINHAKGEWVAFVDSDDWCEPKMFHCMVKYALEQPKTPDILVCDSYVNMRNKQVLNSFYSELNHPFIWNERMKEITFLQIMGRNRYYNAPEVAVGVPWAKLYRRDFLIENSLKFEPELKRMQDNIFNLYAFDHAREVAYLPKPLYHYRKFENSKSNRYSPEVVSDFEKVLWWNKRFLTPYSTNEELMQGYYSRVLQSFHSYMRFWLFNPKNLMHYSQKKQILNELISREPYAQAFKKINLSKCDKSLAIMVTLLRYHCFFLLGMAVKARQKLHKAQNK